MYYLHDASILLINYFTFSDTLYLLQFLRGKKFSQLEARKLLELHLEKKKKLSYMLEDLDASDPTLMQILDSW